MKQGIALHINGAIHEVVVSPNQTLLEVLRDKVGSKGTKTGCDLGACGACTVLVDGEACLSSLILAVDAVGKEIVTIEGLSEEDEFRLLQETLEMVSDFGLRPSGAKQSGEGEEMASASAVLNAICEAIKIDFNELPVTPKSIPTALGCNATKSFSGSRRRQSIS